VSKAKKAGAVVSQVRQLKPAERVDEVARMLGGVTITETTRRHAEEMLGG
jgi:DNA repair protein RecN (Recombination protein N)